jgi:hypothetical protein
MSRRSEADELAAYRQWCESIRSILARVRRVQEDLDELGTRTEALKAGQQALDFGPGEPGADAQGSARRGG